MYIGSKILSCYLQYISDILVIIRHIIHIIQQQELSYILPLKKGCHSHWRWRKQIEEGRQQFPPGFVFSGSRLIFSLMCALVNHKIRTFRSALKNYVHFENKRRLISTATVFADGDCRTNLHLTQNHAKYTRQNIFVCMHFSHQTTSARK